MKNRIRQLLLSEGLTSGAFADEIGVQRSSLSHILNGRNNPSLDFVVKTKNRFPRLNLAWLMMGEGEMYGSDNEDHSTEFRPKQESPTLFQAIMDENKDSPNEFHDEVIEDEVIKEKVSIRKVHQIVVFYTDMTFDAYRPENNA